MQEEQGDQIRVERWSSSSCGYSSWHALFILSAGSVCQTKLLPRPCARRASLMIDFPCANQPLCCLVALIGQPRLCFERLQPSAGVFAASVRVFISSIFLNCTFDIRLFYSVASPLRKPNPRVYLALSWKGGRTGVVRTAKG